MSRRAAIVVVFVAFLAAYALSYSHRPSTDSALNSLQTRSLVRHGDVDLARYGNLPNGYTVEIDAHEYSVYGIGVSLPAIPTYAVLTRLGASEAVLEGSVAIPYAAAAATMFLVLALDVLPRRPAAWATIVFGLGTTVWPIASTAFWQHAPALLMLMVGLRAFLARRALVAGLALGAATLVRPSTAIVGLVLALFYLAFERRELLPLALGALPAAAFYLVSNRWIFGSFTTSSYSLAGVSFDGSIPDAVFPMLLGWWRGLLVYSPALVLGFAGIVLAVRQRDERERRLAFVGLSALVLIVFYAKWATWHGGDNQFGPRYLLDGAPQLCLLGGYALERFERLRAPAMGLGALSVLTMAMGARDNAFAWDQTPFVMSFAGSPIGQAWIDAVDHPLDALGNMLVAAVVAGVVWVASAAPAGSRPTGAPALA